MLTELQELDQEVEEEMYYSDDKDDDDDETYRSDQEEENDHLAPIFTPEERRDMNLDWNVPDAEEDEDLEADRREPGAQQGRESPEEDGDKLGPEITDPNLEGNVANDDPQLLEDSAEELLAGHP